MSSVNSMPIQPDRITRSQEDSRFKMQRYHLKSGPGHQPSRIGARPLLTTDKFYIYSSYVLLETCYTI
ncbi:hypothetical protein OUZ56_020582 [Daphnia magna]|uniref:Uncharacterized protein n=1 Tax=Daphnia magna TaxID=35525 RepID=A0ABQ9ZEU7_9CRUS|nr:hypothetical protein OUZ56_020582 [Daphnia magna]